jgi:hypothetical protein
MPPQMSTLLRHPLVILVLSYCVMAGSAQLGLFFRRNQQQLEDADYHDRGVVLGATLTLLGLLIGFTFSMAISRYDQRKNCEEQEANAIGTEYLRSDMLSQQDAPGLRIKLMEYLDQRIYFYRSRDEQELQKINAYTAKLQSELWSAVLPKAVTQPTTITGLIVSGMNDVLNAQSYTQAAWWNRIPVGAWLLLAAVAVFSNFLAGYNLRSMRAANVRLLLLPLVVSIAFFLIAEIDSPRRGVIQVTPQNLLSLAHSLPSQ